MKKIHLVAAATFLAAGLLGNSGSSVAQEAEFNEYAAQGAALGKKIGEKQKEAQQNRNLDHSLAALIQAKFAIKIEIRKMEHELRRTQRTLTEEGWSRSYLSEQKKAADNLKETIERLNEDLAEVEQMRKEIMEIVKKD